MSEDKQTTAAEELLAALTEARNEESADERGATPVGVHVLIIYADTDGAFMIDASAANGETPEACSARACEAMVELTAAIQRDIRRRCAEFGPAARMRIIGPMGGGKGGAKA